MPVLIFLIYRLFQILGAPLIVLYLLWRGAGNRRWFRSIPGRFGGLPFSVTGPGGVWLHAVSVGEVLSAVALLREFRDRLPDTPLYVSVTTVAGYSLAQDKLTGLCDGIFYTPLDYCFAVRRVLRAIRPSLVLVLETEIWPNLWRETKRTGAGLMVANGRISDRAFPKYRRLRWFFRPVLALPDAIYAQSEQDYHRYLDLGAPEDRAFRGTNLKYDLSLPAPRIAPELDIWISTRGAAKIVIAASTMPGVDAADADEDDLVLDAFQELAGAVPGLLWIHVPRRPERFDIAAAKLQERGIRFVRRSSLADLALPCVLLLDTVGELGSLFSCCDAVFMGGTLVRRGGHNILEPAFFGKPVVAGPNMQNFAEIAREFTNAGALVRIDEPRELAPALRRLLDEPGDIGEKARALAESKSGAARDTALAAIEVLECNWSRPVHPLPRRILLGPLSKLWSWAGERSRRRKAAGARRLDVPVVSVGGLSMGGSGKTPAVLHLAQYFRGCGLQSGILTRGYKRQSIEDVVLVRAGDSAPVRETGDEAQIFLRSGAAHLGVSGNRFEAGTRLLKKWPVAVLLLDDGFQHRQLHRDFDLVLLDAQEPLRDVFPLGRLREAATGLQRAGAVLLTRVHRGREYRQLRAFIHRINPNLPIFCSRVVAGAWSPDVLPAGKVAAFCGLGNPASFWSTLRLLGLNPIYRWAFGDHHQYRPAELQRLRHNAIEKGAELLVTTEKDRVNLPEGWPDYIHPLPLYSLHIEIAIQDEPDLLRLITDRAGLARNAQVS